MAYIFLLENDNEIVASRREVLMQRSKLVDEVWFLVNPKYKTCENDMSVFSVMLEYILPTSKSYHSLELVQDKEGYKEYLKYVVPFDSNLSSESGDIELQLSFIYVGLDADGNGIQKVRKTRPAKLHITPVAAWADIIPDSALSALDQRILKMDAQMKYLNEMNQIVADTKADNIKYNENENSLQLLSGDKEIGNKVTLKTNNVSLEDGVPVVDFNNISGGDISDDDEDENVVEF